MCEQERHQRDQCRTGKQEREGGGFAGKAARLPEFVGDAQADKSWERHFVVQIKRIGKGRLKMKFGRLKQGQTIRFSDGLSDLLHHRGPAATCLPLNY